MILELNSSEYNRVYDLAKLTVESGAIQPIVDYFQELCNRAIAKNINTIRDLDLGIAKRQAEEISELLAKYAKEENRANAERIKNNLLNRS